MYLYFFYWQARNSFQEQHPEIRLLWTRCILPKPSLSPFGNWATALLLSRVSTHCTHCTSSSLWKLPDKRTTHTSQRVCRERIPFMLQLWLALELHLGLGFLACSKRRDNHGRRCAKRGLRERYVNNGRECARCRLCQRYDNDGRRCARCGEQREFRYGYGDDTVAWFSASITLSQGFTVPSPTPGFYSLCVILISSSRNLNDCEGWWTRDIGDVNLRNLMNIAWQFWYADWPLIQEMAQEDGFLSMMS